MEEASSDRVISVFVVDDRMVPRVAAKTLLDQLDGFRHVGEASSVGEAVNGIRRVRPDVVLLDVEMPDGGGAAVARRIHEIQPETRMLAWTVSEVGDDLVEMIASGCVGYVLKDSGPDELRRAMIAAMHGEYAIPRKLMPSVLQRAASVRRTKPPPDLHLTPRELELLNLLGNGLSRKEAGYSMGISLHSVDFHRKSLYRKLSATNRTEALARAREWGLPTH